MPYSHVVSLLPVTVLLLVSLSCQGEARKARGDAAVADRALAVRDDHSPRAAERNQDGIDHLGWKHWRKAAADFRRAIESDPALPEPHFNLALALYELGQDQEAEEHLRASLAIAPDNPRILDDPLSRRLSE
jgi:Tfp pilus assembly protein PilF